MYINNLSLELNNIIKSYLITEKSNNFNLYNLTDLYIINYKYCRINNKTWLTYFNTTMRAYNNIITKFFFCT